MSCPYLDIPSEISFVQAMTLKAMFAMVFFLKIPEVKPVEFFCLLVPLVQWG